MIMCVLYLSSSGDANKTTEPAETEIEPAQVTINAPEQDSPDHYIPKRKPSATIAGEVNVEVPKFFVGDNSETAV